ncbi:MAG: NAD(P)-dependent oxidoreductase [Bacillota bacterium]|nr:NAD(P)-dependent oxidoreductase [Bacillota bacterium]
MKDVLLTGARGFIGSHCLEALIERGFTVHAVSGKGRRNSYREGVEWHHADLHNAEHVLCLMAEVKPQYLLHLAWDVTHGVYWRSLENLRWVKTSLSLLQAFINGGGSRALMVGSCAEYDWNYGYCTEELTPLQPGTLYGVCKDALHKVATAAAAESGVSHAWARLFFLYGPGEQEDRLLPAVISSLLKGEEAFCTHGEQIRDYMYIKDAASALAALLDSDVTGAVNIASGHPVVLKDLIAEAAKLTGRPDLVRLGALAVSADDQPLLLANTGRLNDEVKWYPRYSLQDGLKETVQWWQQKMRA